MSQKFRQIILLSKAGQLYSEWQDSINDQYPYGKKESFAALVNFVKPNRPDVTWKKLGLEEEEVTDITNARTVHDMDVPKTPKQTPSYVQQRTRNKPAYTT